MENCKNDYCEFCEWHTESGKCVSQEGCAFNFDMVEDERVGK